MNPPAKAPILRPPNKPASIVTFDWLVRLPDPKPQPAKDNHHAQR